MGLFDKIFGRGATETQQQPNAQQQFEQLRSKYQPALTVADQQQIQFTNMYVQDGKLVVSGIAPSEEAKNAFFQQTTLIDGGQGELNADIRVDQSRAQAATAGGGNSGGESYTVKSGDTLSKISKQFYGDSDEFMRIFYANRDQLNDPDKIQVGQQLQIPPDDNA